MEHWVRGVVPEAVRQVARHAGDRPVHLVGWGMGGILALLTAAHDADLPVATLTTLGSPVDVTQVPLVAPVRPFLGVAGEEAAPIALASRLIGGIPEPLVRRARALPAFGTLVTKPFVQLAKLDDTEFLAQVEAVDRFSAGLTVHPGRSYGQLYHRMVHGNELATGVVHLGGRDVRLADVGVPVLVLAGADDTIAPVGGVRPVEGLLGGAPELRFEVVPGGHLGMLTGRRARSTTWPLLDGFLESHSTPAQPEAASPSAASPSAASPSAASPSAASPSAASPSAASPSAASPSAASPSAAEPPVPVGEPVIGTNRERRYASTGSRGLAPRRSAGSRRVDG
jgi:polyhydroxyalkanoate synthase